MTDENTTHDKPRTISESVHLNLTAALSDIKAAMETPEFDGELQLTLMVVPKTDGVPTGNVDIATIMVVINVNSLTPEEYTGLVAGIQNGAALQEARGMDLTATAPSTETRQ